MRKHRKMTRKIVRYFRETARNKVIASALLACGIVTLKMSGDGTALMLVSMFAVPTFFARTSWT